MRDLKAGTRPRHGSKRDREQDEFGEFLPTHTNRIELFNQSVEDYSKPVKTKILRNLALLTGILILQIAFFYMLVQYSLGLSF